MIWASQTRLELHTFHSSVQTCSRSRVVMCPVQVCWMLGETCKSDRFTLKAFTSVKCVFTSDVGFVTALLEEIKLRENPVKKETGQNKYLSYVWERETRLSEEKMDKKNLKWSLKKDFNDLHWVRHINVWTHLCFYFYFSKHCKKKRWRRAWLLKKKNLSEKIFRNKWVYAENKKAKIIFHSPLDMFSSHVFLENKTYYLVSLCFSGEYILISECWDNIWETGM